MKSLRTAIQAVVAFFLGLVGVVWTTHGVPDNVTNYVTNNVAQVVLALGVPSYLVTYLWHFLLEKYNVKAK